MLRSLLLGVGAVLVLGVLLVALDVISLWPESDVRVIGDGSSLRELEEHEAATLKALGTAKDASEDGALVEIDPAALLPAEVRGGRRGGGSVRGRVVR
ncbi:MAG: hypothetical protein O2894_00945, partial [Planctomycetota bacterium]|nr:hypothetical protein [Planctomycetota bacterium]